MVVELITVGTEILMGNIVNTNAQYMAANLTKLGAVIQYQETVGDNRERLSEVFKTAMSRADIVILSGGLGPTEDDLTRDVCAEVLHMPLKENPAIRSGIEDYVRKGNFKLTDNNFRQAMVPEGALVLENSNGTAPGLILRDGARSAVLLPGPPHEMKPMFEEQVVPYIRSLSPEHLASVMIKIAGIGESQVEDTLLDLIDRQTNPTIATYAKLGEVDVRVTAKADSEAKAEELLKPVVREIVKRFGESVFTQEENQTLADTVVGLLKKKGLTLTTAESLTGGMIASRITDVPGASQIFKLGFVTYSNKAKKKVLSVKKELLKKDGAVSADCARDMAVGAVLESEADISVAITGNAGPDAMENKPVGLVYISCYAKGKTQVLECHFNGDRAKIREQSVMKALDLVRRTILEKY